MKNAFQIARNTFSEKYKGIYNKEPIKFIVWTKVDWKFEMDWQLLEIFNVNVEYKNIYIFCLLLKINLITIMGVH